MNSLNARQIKKVAAGEYQNPFDVLGLHTSEKETVVRCLNPKADSVEVVAGSDRKQMTRLDPDGLFELRTSGTIPKNYRFRITFPSGKTQTIHDPYNPRFQSLLDVETVQKFAGGNDTDAYQFLGAHVTKNDGVSGTNFVVWAPNARYVRIAGTFNGWSLTATPMRNTRIGGLWELFVPGLKKGDLYKYVINTKSGKTYVKADPYARAAQLRPKKSSIVWKDDFRWGDRDWIRKRKEQSSYSTPLSIYEVHLSSWIRKDDDERPFYTYEEIAEDLIPYVRKLGFTHIELMPIMEHPLDESWGYQVTNYFAPSSRFGDPDGLKHLINECHRAGVGVILDWVPGHFPRDPHGLYRFDGTAIYEHADPRQGYHPDWKTAIFNCGRHEVRSFLLSNANYWLKEFHVDGLRIDAVASMLYLDYSRKKGQWIPNKYGGNENLEAISFLKALNRMVQEQHPGVQTLAEESTAWSGVTRPYYAGGLGFTYKWNMGWMHDSLAYFEQDPIHRKYHQNKLTFMLSYAFREKFCLVLSHDEVVHGKKSLVRKMPGDAWHRFANLRLLYSFMFAHPGKKLLFMGSEFAQLREWSVNREIDWYLLEKPEHKRIQRCVTDLNALYRREPAMHANDTDWNAFEWIDNRDSRNSVITFQRRHEDSLLLFAFNMTPIPRTGYRFGVSEPGFYREIFNSNAGIYGGSDDGNHPGASTVEEFNPQNRPHTLTLNLPALSMTALKLESPSNNSE